MARKLLPVSTDQLSLPFNRSGLFPFGDNRQTVSVPELIQLTGYPASTIEQWIRHGKIPGAMQLAKGYRWRFQRDELEKWWKGMRKTR